MVGPEFDLGHVTLAGVDTWLRTVRSPKAWPGVVLPMSTSTRLLSCSSTTCCMLRSSGIFAHRFISGSCHHLQRPPQPLASV